MLKEAYIKYLNIKNEIILYKLNLFIHKLIFVGFNLEKIKK